MAEISEKEVKAALSAWNNYNNSGPVAEDRSDAMRVALEAAARVRAEANAEPVAWTGSWSLNALSHGHEGFIYPEETEAHPIPLFTHPAPQPSGTEAMVEALRNIDAEAPAKEPRDDWTSTDLDEAFYEGKLRGFWEMAVYAREALTAARVREEAHADDAAVDRFAAAMKAKLKWEREERGRHGWNDPEVCSEEYLAKLLIEHLAKGNEGNFEDIANFCMMLHQRGAHPRVLAAAFATAGKPEQAVPSGTVEALKRITQLKEVRRGGGAFDYEPALSAMEMYEIAFDALSALTAGMPETDYFGSLVERARAAAAKASEKFPQPNYVTLKIAEEAGEVVRGAVHYAERRMEWSEVEGEIIQLLAMLIRFVTEGDQVNGIVPPTEGGGDE